MCLCTFIVLKQPTSVVTNLYFLLCHYYRIYFVFLLPHMFPVGRLVWEEKDLEAETRAEGTEGRHLHAWWQDRDGQSRKIKKFLSFVNEQKKNGKEKQSGAKIFALSSPCVWHFICFDFFSPPLSKWLKNI